MSEKSIDRPKADEDEDELLRQMAQFEASKSSISKQNVVSFAKKKPSKFAQQRAAAKSASTEAQNSTKSESTTSVLKAVIQEREFDYDQFTKQLESRKSDETTNAFPTVMKLDKIVSNSDTNQSLFSRLSLDKAPKNINLESKIVRREHDRDWSMNQIRKVKILNETEKQDIHESNVAILDSMSDEQLQEEKNAILAQMKPEIVQMLMKRRASKRPQNETETEIKMEVDPKKPNVIDENLTKKKYFNMDKIESDKMEWMQNIQEEDKSDVKPANFNARFDFQGKNPLHFIFYAIDLSRLYFTPSALLTRVCAVSLK